MSSLLIAGATGQVGVFLLPRLLHAGFRVTALSRRLMPATTVRPQPGEGRLRWLHPDSFAAEEDQSTPVEALISAGPVGLAADLVARLPDLRRVVLFSSSSVRVKADSPLAAERAMMHSILAAEDRVRDACARRGIALWLLQPTLIYGCGLDRNVSRLARLIRRFRFLPVAGPAAGLRQPVHADDLAALAVRALTQDDGAGLASPVAGGETLTYRAMAERIFTAFGLRPRLLSMRPALLAGLADAAGSLLRIDGLNAQVVLRQNRDLCFDDTAVRASLGHDPRPFHPTPADFTIPPEASVLQP